jgi:hypothetical protein
MDKKTKEKGPGVDSLGLSCCTPCMNDILGVEVPFTS